MAGVSARRPGRGRRAAGDPLIRRGVCASGREPTISRPGSTWRSCGLGDFALRGVAAFAVTAVSAAPFSPAFLSPALLAGGSTQVRGSAWAGRLASGSRSPTAVARWRRARCREEKVARMGPFGPRRRRDRMGEKRPGATRVRCPLGIAGAALRHQLRIPGMMGLSSHVCRPSAEKPQDACLPGNPVVCRWKRTRMRMPEMNTPLPSRIPGSAMARR